MIRIAEYPTSAPNELDKSTAKKELNRMAKRIAELHQLMFAEKKHSLLIVFQGMDASGKDGATRNVFKHCSPNGINASSFKRPTDEEFDHDFLWRCHKLTPRKGTIQVFIRSHYEDILIQRVHNWIDKEHVHKRIRAINEFERTMHFDNNTTVLKFFLNISFKRQEEKLQERIDVARKNWKHNPGDWEERKYWDRYMFCYEEAINKCNIIPWIITPVDHRWYRNYFIAKKVLETMENWDMKFPGLPKEG